MRVVFSIGNRVGGVGGICKVAYHEVEGIRRKGYLKQLISIPYPFNKLASVRPYETAVIFDRYAEATMQKCDIFHGWMSMCLESLKKAKSLGAKTFIEGSSTHPAFQNAVLKEEYQKYNLLFGTNTKLRNRIFEELKLVDYITTPSEFARDTYVYHGFPKENLFVVPYGVDSKEFTPSRIPPDKFTVLYTGQVCLRKGVQYLLEAWDTLKLEDAELHLVGKVWEEMNPIIEKYKNNATITVYGKVEDMLPYYQNASVFCFPSLEEGSALVTYEALSCGLPIITTPNAGSVAEDGNEAIIIEPKNTKDIADAIGYLYENQGEIIRMGENARKKAEEFTWEKCGNNLVKIYEQLVR